MSFIVSKFDSKIHNARSKTLIVYGYYSGQVILDDGTKIDVDHLLGHAETIRWRW